MICSYQGERKERVVANVTSLEFVMDQVGSWSENQNFIFAMDVNTHPEKCGDFYCSVAAIYYREIEKILLYKCGICN